MPKKDAPKRDASKNVPKTQTIIVPKGTIDPSDDTFIEIPAGLHTQPIVIAKKKDNSRILSRTLIDESCRSRHNACDSKIVNKSYTDASTLPCSTRQVGTADLIFSRPSQAPDLHETEEVEKEVVLKQLDEFQKARRKFLTDTAAVASTSSTANVGPKRSGCEFRDRNARLDNCGTQTIPPPIPLRYKMRDSLVVAREHLNLNRTKPLNLLYDVKQGGKKYTDAMDSCSSMCNNKGSRNNLEELDDTDVEEGEETGHFAPGLNSTFTVKKKSNCETCCSKPSQEDSGRRVRRGDKPSEAKRTKETMEKSPSRTSEGTTNISTAESCLSTDCTHGSHKNDTSCTPCCKVKLSGTLAQKKSTSLLPDEDFEKIKEQLREARKKLDEAVAMVSRTVASSSSCYTASKMKPETDVTPRSSKIGNISPQMSRSSSRAVQEQPASKTTKHDLAKCPLSDMAGLSNEFSQPRTSKSKSTADSLLCLDMCSHLPLPPCVSKEVLKPKTGERQQSPRKIENSPSSSFPCTLTFPCAIPSAMSGQSSTDPPVILTRSLPTTSSKVDDGQRRSPTKPKFTDQREYPVLREHDSRHKSTWPKYIDETEYRRLKEDESRHRSSTRSKYVDDGEHPRLREEESRHRSSSRSKSADEGEHLRLREDESRHRSSCRSKSADEGEHLRLREDECRHRSSSRSKSADEGEHLRLREDECRHRSSSRSKSADEGEHLRLREDESRHRSSSRSKSADEGEHLRLREDESRHRSSSRSKSADEGEHLRLREAESRHRSSSRSKSADESEYPRLREAESRHRSSTRSKSADEGEYPRLKEAESRHRSSSRSRPIDDDTGHPLDRYKSSSSKFIDGEYPRVKESASKRSNVGCSVGSSRSRDLNALCSNLCLNMDTPPCTSEELLMKRTGELVRSLRRLSDNVVSMVGMPCTPMLPCSFPQGTLRQDVSRPQSPSTSRSLPVSSTKIEEVRQRSDPSPKMKEDNSYLRFSENVGKKTKGGGVSTASQTTKPSTVDLLCSAVCMNLDPPPCQSEKEPSKKPATPPSSRVSSPSPNALAIACIPPCDLASGSAKPDRAQSPTRSTKSQPTSHTSIPETEKAVILPKESLTKKTDDKEPLATTSKGKEPKKVKTKTKAVEEGPPSKGNKEIEKSSLRKAEDKEEEGKVLLNTSTQTHTEKTVTLFKSNFENEEALEEEQVHNALMNSLDMDEKVTKTTTVKFKKNKK